MAKLKLYAGIGSRQTPEHILRLMERIAQRLAELGYVLRTGGAAGADSAFIKGATAAGGRVEVFLPWPNFNGMKGEVGVTDFTRMVASIHHPKWEALSQGVQKLHSRNVAVLLGPDGRSPVDFVICWTDNEAGGTGHAIRVADTFGIPVVNLYHGRKALHDIAELVR